MSDGSYIVDNVNTAGGDFVGRDKITYVYPPEEKIPSPPPPVRPPYLDRFVGRQQELARYTEKLATNRPAVITGFVGLGKTVLAAQLAMQSSPVEKIFWHRCLPNEGVNAIIWALAAFLSANGNQNLWQTLYRLSRNSEFPPVSTLINYIFEFFTEARYVVCLDDVHNLKVDQTHTLLIERLWQAVRDGHVRLIVTAQDILTIGDESDPEPLEGLTLADARQLFAAQKVELDESLLRSLHERTEGNAELLILTVHAVKRAKDKGKLIDRLVKAQEVSNFLLELVDRGLSDDERGVMYGVATLLGWPSTADEIAQVVAQPHVKRTLIFLCNRYLLQATEGEGDTEYDEHVMLQAFYYDLLDRSQRLELHRRAARYYEQLAEPEIFKAALHRLHAEEYEQAGLLATEDMRQHYYRGRANAIRLLLERFNRRQLSTEVWLRVCLAKGDAYTFLQMTSPAKSSYLETYDQSSTLLDLSVTRTFRRQACRGLGFLLKSSTPDEALEWLQRGLELSNGTDQRSEANLLIQLGAVYTNLGRHQDARQAFERALTNLPEELSRLYLWTFLGLGKHHYYQGDLTQSSNYFYQALQAANELGDPFNALSTRVNLGAFTHTLGRWSEAADYYQQVIREAEQLGKYEERTRAMVNWGALFSQQGNHEQAQELLTTGLAQARSGNVRNLAIIALCYLAQLALDQGQLDIAKGYLGEAEGLLTEGRFGFLQPFLLYGWARLCLENKDAERAENYARQALTEAQQRKMRQEEGQAWRILGQAQLAQQQPDQAVESFKASAACLSNVPYELGLTTAAWARCLLQCGDTVRGHDLFAEAQKIFSALGITQELSQ